ncbi:MAG: glycosyltransferase [Anaerolineae bacterium]
MRVAVVGRTYLLRANRAKWRYLPDEMELTLITPGQRRHVLRVYPVERSDRWPHRVVPTWLTDRLSGFVFAPLPLWRALWRARPQLIQVDEEPSSLALLEVLFFKLFLNYRTIFFTWENLSAGFPPPFAWVRRLALRLADGAIAGNSEAATLLQDAGFQKPLVVIPQLGVDPDHFSPQHGEEIRRSLGVAAFTVGYAGRLVPEKGLMLLLEALSQLDCEWRWLIVGRGPLKASLEQEARKCGLGQRLVWIDTVPHVEVPRYLSAMDVLVLPSQTTPSWKEQFGHVLIEAMACGVPVVGSDSGAIPEVIGDAGLIFPEGRADLLAQQLRLLQKDVSLRKTLGERGRERVLSNYTDQYIAGRTAAFWREILLCK